MGPGLPLRENRDDTEKETEVQNMPRARNASVELEYQTFGDDHPEAVLLVNGLGSQMTRWPEAFCRRNC